ncbi:MAG: hypothetical protein AAF456_06510 [Planctomycetota bacterium]
MRQGFMKAGAVVILVVCAALVGVAMMLSRSSTPPLDTSTILTSKAFRADFVNSVNEAGDIESSSNIELRCEVKSRGSSGTAIIEIVPEGTEVREGDFICQFDDSALREELTERRIGVAQDQASVIEAKSSLDTARRTLVEYENGIYEQERAALDAAKALAEENLRRAVQYLRHSQKLNAKGFTTQTQLEADAFAVEKAQLDLDLAIQNLDVYERFTMERMLAEFNAEIQKQEANVQAAEFTLELSEMKETETEQQIAACRIVAPADGLVVYANENDRDDSFVIEEGAVMRYAQPVVYLPDPELMQVRTRVNGSKINSIGEGCRALIRVDTAPESPVAGVVRHVNKFSEPRRWYQAPIEYQVFVDVTEQSPLIRSGQRGKVEIIIEEIPNAVQVPLSSIVRANESYFVLTRNETDGELTPVPVEIGSNNDKFIVIEDGIEPGQDVVIDGDSFADDVRFPISEQAAQ